MDQIGSAEYRPFTDKEFILYGLQQDHIVLGQIWYSHVWEPHLVAVLERVVRPNFICLDVGANIGAITLPLAHLASQGHVHAFEASPTAWSFLGRNVKENSLVNVTPMLAGITDHSGDAVEIFRTDADLGCAHISRLSGRAGVREEVRTLALDDYPLEHVDFIKIDIEGGEVEALAGARRLLEKYRPVLVIEYNPTCIEEYTGNSRRALYDVLAELYPRIEIINKADGGMQTVSDWDQLDRELTEHTYRDLLCTHTKP